MGTDEQDDLIAWFRAFVVILGRVTCILAVLAACAWFLHSIATNPQHHVPWGIKGSVFAVVFIVTNCFIYMALIFRMITKSNDALSPTLAICFAEVSITVILTYFALMYSDYGLIDSDRHTIHDLPTALYFSVVTFTTVGYGDIQPTIDSRVFASIEAITGIVYAGLLVGMFVGLVVRQSDEKRSSVS
ncbi:MAG: hypothetical protein DME97_14760 [Verrucomicrobia bacterium]|nr:MAG: hypothetical protein DME97_14760 [Verrucomicrobiota bacterium]